MGLLLKLDIFASSQKWELLFINQKFHYQKKLLPWGNFSIKIHINGLYLVVKTLNSAIPSPKLITKNFPTLNPSNIHPTSLVKSCQNQKVSTSLTSMAKNYPCQKAMNIFSFFELHISITIKKS